MEAGAIHIVPDSGTILGESTLWSPRDGQLYWVDCNRPELVRMDIATGEKKRWPMPRRIGGVVLGEAGPIVALSDGIYALSPDSGELSLIAPRPFDSDHLFLHEARCDRAGRLWVGLINHEFITSGASGGCELFRLDGDRLVAQPLASGGTVSNGLAWSPAGDVMYYADTPTRVIWAFDYDNATGDLSNKRVFKELPEDLGMPDGATVDEQGGYWSTLPGAGKLMRLLPDGSVDRFIDVPVAFPTMPAFAGANLDMLYVSSLSFILSPEELAAAPINGSMIMFEPGERGIEEAMFKPA